MDKKAKILIIEDEKTIRMELEGALQRWDMRRLPFAGFLTWLRRP